MKIVHKIESGMDRHNVLCTTYQMRNMYRQFGDGYFTVLDVMNYIQHCHALKYCKKGSRVLDVCCGRGLMLPLLRYHGKSIDAYVGVDINASNSKFTSQRVTNGTEISDDYYPFEVDFVHSNVADMSMVIDGGFDVILYMASIEHMHKDTGVRSLVECRKLISPNGVMFLTCPNTPEGQDGYDTQYKAHVYEWKVSELNTELANAGFDVVDTWGILANKRDIVDVASGDVLKFIERIASYVPRDWLLPVLAPAFVDVCKEVAIEAIPNDGVMEDLRFSDDDIQDILGRM